VFLAIPSDPAPDRLGAGSHALSSRSARQLDAGDTLSRGLPTFDCSPAGPGRVAGAEPRVSSSHRACYSVPSTDKRMCDLVSHDSQNDSQRRGQPRTVAAAATALAKGLRSAGMSMDVRGHVAVDLQNRWLLSTVLQLSSPPSMDVLSVGCMTANDSPQRQQNVASPKESSLARTQTGLPTVFQTVCVRHPPARNRPALTASEDGLFLVQSSCQSTATSSNDLQNVCATEWAGSSLTASRRRPFSDPSTKRHYEFIAVIPWTAPSSPGWASTIETDGPPSESAPPVRAVMRARGKRTQKLRSNRSPHSRAGVSDAS